MKFFLSLALSLILMGSAAAQAEVIFGSTGQGEMRSGPTYAGSDPYAKKDQKGGPSQADLEGAKSTQCKESDKNCDYSYEKARQRWFSKD